MSRCPTVLGLARGFLASERPELRTATRGDLGFALPTVSRCLFVTVVVRGGLFDAVAGRAGGGALEDEGRGSREVVEGGFPLPGTELPREVVEAAVPRS